MKLSLCCANFIKKYRISIPLRKCNGPSKDSVFYRTNSHILNRKFYSFAFCNFKCFVGNSFHTASPLKAKSFQEKENEYAHSIMENLPSYHSSVVRSLVPSGSSSSNATSEVVKEFAQDGGGGGEHLVFVYGTLKRGEPNYDVLQDQGGGSASYVGVGRTVDKWPMVIASRYNIPFLLYAKGKGKNVRGELFRVDDRMLSNLDRLECHPTYYTRVREEVQPEGSTPLRPWIYFLISYRDHLLQLPHLEDYTSKGDHGLEYVPRYTRTQGEYHTDVQTENTSDPEDIYR